MVLVETTGSGVTAVIANRVDTARETFSLLKDDYEAVLLTGRIRPYDRDILLESWLPRLSAGRSLEDLEPSCGRGYSNGRGWRRFDFDAMLPTEPFSALRQRLGRLNRLGRQDHAEAIVVQRDTEDGVYPPRCCEAGMEMAHCPRWLCATENISLHRYVRSGNYPVAWAWRRTTGHTTHRGANSHSNLH